MADGRTRMGRRQELHGYGWLKQVNQVGKTDYPGRSYCRRQPHEGAPYRQVGRQ